MKYQHQSLARGRWRKVSFVEQMAHIGSEVERAIAWKQKGNASYSQMAFDRALELLDLTLSQRLPPPALREVARVRELLVDWFVGENSYGSSDIVWQKYFRAFTFAARSTRSLVVDGSPDVLS